MQERASAFPNSCWSRNSPLHVRLLVGLACLSAGCHAWAVDYSYDALGRLAQVQLDDGTRIDYTYDAAGNFVSIVTGTAATVAPSPVNVTIRPGNQKVTIAFDPPPFDGGMPVTGYTATCTPVSGGASLGGVGTASPVVVSGLTNGTAYNCSVAATNGVGAGAPSSVATVTPLLTTWRSFVSATGSDGNAAAACALATPCRQFAAALSVTDDGGEIVVLDSANYGYVVIDRSITINAPPGIYAGMSVFPIGGNPTGAGITIAGAGANVTLKGITINGMGGDYGIRVADAARLTLENCTVANFGSPWQYAVVVAGAVDVRMLDTTLRDNNVGLYLQDGPNATINRSRFLGNTIGLVADGAFGGTTTAQVSNAVFKGGNDGFLAYAVSGATARVSATDSVFENNAGRGGYAAAAGGIAQAVVSRSLVAGNGTGLEAAGVNATLLITGNSIVRNTVGVAQSSDATVRAFGTNSLAGNGSATVGTISPSGTQ